MLRPTILVAIIGSVTSCKPTTTTTAAGTETAETTLVSLMNWNQSANQGFQQMYEREATPKLSLTGDIKSIQAEDVNGWYALKYTIANTTCSEVKSTVKEVIGNGQFFRNATTTCS
ncbi:hypothetical protein V3C99_000102 [Haemonchus contortus]